MDTLSGGEAAVRLGVSLPTVHRLAARLGLGGQTRRGAHRRFSPADMDAMAARIGAVPAVPDGFSREQTLVLATLARRPLGLRSARAVARLTGLSPTTAGKVLANLEASGWVSQREQQVIEGRVKRVTVWLAAVEHPDWWRLAPVLTGVVLPVRKAPPPAHGVPRRLEHLFWNGDVADLDLQRDGRFIAVRLLQSNDPEGMVWAIDHLSAADLRSIPGVRGLDPSIVAMAQNAARGKSS